MTQREPLKTEYLVLNGSDGYRAACLEHDWLSPTLRSTYAVAAVDYLKHYQESHQ
jgi:hypothetical protein